jgi:hypothetical protein
VLYEKLAFFEIIFNIKNRITNIDKQIWAVYHNICKRPNNIIYSKKTYKSKSLQKVSYIV